MSTIHLLALPNANTTAAYSLDGFSQMTIRMAKVLKALGRRVILYAGEENEAPCDELVSVISLAEQRAAIGPNQYQNAVMTAENPLWKLTSPRIADEIGKRKGPRDIIFSIGGSAQASVSNAHPDLMDVEYSIGYPGNCARYRVFESRAWQHYCYGAQSINTVRFYDAVIPGFFDESEFKVGKPEPYVAYVGRLVPRKGISIACDAAKAAGVPLKVVGHGDPKLVTYGEYLGPLSTPDRNDVLSRASAVICPTMYIEPFNCVAVEAQMCGTPAIVTPQGGFLETVEDGETGWHCHLLGDFVNAITESFRGERVNRPYVRERAHRLYGLKAAEANYGAYLARLDTLWDKGWATLG